MAYCRQCGAALQEGNRYCPACGAPAEGTGDRAERWTHLEETTGKPKKKKKSLFKRWWFWALILIVAAAAAGRSGTRTSARPAAKPSAPISAPASKTAASPTEEPEAEPQAAVSKTEIRPEVKEFLDAYEACMDEYVDFMQKYQNADSNTMLSMMGEYYEVLARYTEFTEKIDAYEENELTNAELAYYIEVNNRVSQKLLSVAG